MDQMDQAKLEALLKRSLTSREVANRELYLEQSKEQLEALLCISLCCADSGVRIYTPREDMRTVFADIFTDVDEIKVGGEVVTEYHKAFWDNRNGSFFNSIVFDCAPDEDVEIDASWGFDSLPIDLQGLWARMFALVSKPRSTSNIKSKKTEDFSITYGDETDMETFQHDNAITIRKYAMCYIGDFRSGGDC